MVLLQEYAVIGAFALEDHSPCLECESRSVCGIFNGTSWVPLGCIRAIRELCERYNERINKVQLRVRGNA